MDRFFVDFFFVDFFFVDFVDFLELVDFVDLVVLVDLVVCFVDPAAWTWSDPWVREVLAPAMGVAASVVTATRAIGTRSRHRRMPSPSARNRPR